MWQFEFPFQHFILNPQAIQQELEKKENLKWHYNHLEKLDTKKEKARWRNTLAMCFDIWTWQYLSHIGLEGRSISSTMFVSQHWTLTFPTRAKLASGKQILTSQKQLISNLIIGLDF